MKHSIILGLGFVLFSLFAILFIFPSNTKASPEVRTLNSLVDGDQICTVSDERLTKAMTAFEKMMPTFQHPRCANCHGGVQPFAANTNHAGDKFDLVLDSAGDPDYIATFKACEGCHGALKNWEVPDEDDFFVGKDAVELCKQMKVLGQAEAFIDHIARDRGKTPFIETAFKGMRGLSEEGIDFYEALFDKKPVAEPPAISHAALIDQAKAWVDALGGEFQGDLSCGCEPQHYALKIEESYSADYEVPKARIQWNGGTQVQIPLKFNDDGSFTGEMTSDRNMNVILTSAISCNVNATSKVQWQVNGTFDKDANKMTFSVRFTPSAGFVPCGMVQLPLPIDDSENANNPLKKVELAALVGETQTAEVITSVGVSPSKDTFKITIVKVE